MFKKLKEEPKEREKEIEGISLASCLFFVFLFILSLYLALLSCPALLCLSFHLSSLIFCLSLSLSFLISPLFPFQSSRSISLLPSSYPSLSLSIQPYLLPLSLSSFLPRFITLYVILFLSNALLRVGSRQIRIDRDGR